MAAPMVKRVEDNKAKVISLTKNVEDFLGSTRSFSTELCGSLKGLYDTTKAVCECGNRTESLPELIVTDFDDEQIWQQLELDNDLCLTSLLSNSSKILANKTTCSFKAEVGRKSKSANSESSNLLAEASVTNTKKKLLRKKANVKSNRQETTPVDTEKETKAHDSSEDYGSSDEELEKIKQDIDDIDKEDKFFDFTGDSDEDLNFDFGPLGQGDVDEEIFKSGSEDETNIVKNRKKKSVTFEDQIDSLEGKTAKKKDVKTAKKPTKKGSSIVDDKFFKLADLEEFLEKEDRREERRIRQKNGDFDESKEDESDDDDADIDMFADIEAENEDLHYDDFFDPPDGETYDGKVGKKSASAEETDDSEDESDDEEEMDDGEDASDDEEEEDHHVMKREPTDLFEESESEGEDVTDIIGGKREQKSSFEVRQEKLKKKMSSLENEMMSEKPWQMSGEITGGKRPENSLLQENLQFDHTSRLPPEITEETTKTLEDMIRQRIKDKAWDDVERKIKPKEAPFEYKKRISLDQEKSKQSLSEIYEQEYLKQQKADEVEKLDPGHEEIQKSMQALFIKLDALSNFHYTPKQASTEIQIITNQPSIMMEEVAPVSVSDRQLLAPEEVKDKPRDDLKGDTEKTKSDRLRQRKEKKKQQRIRQKEKEKRQKLVEKLNHGLGNKYSKEKALQKLEKDSKTSAKSVTLIKGDKGDNSSLTSSKAFFTQLQEEVVSSISKKKQMKRKGPEVPVLGGKALKL